MVLTAFLVEEILRYSSGPICQGLFQRLIASGDRLLGSISNLSPAVSDWNSRNQRLGEIVDLG